MLKDTSGYLVGGDNVLDLAILPSSLRNLTTDTWTYDISRLQDFQSVGITSLHLSHTNNSLADIHKLLQYLPGLKVEILFLSFFFNAAHFILWFQEYILCLYS